MTLTVPGPSSGVSLSLLGQLLPGGAVATPQAAAARAVTSSHAEYTVADPTNPYRRDVWRFGHTGEEYHLERTQNGVVLREARGTAATNPALVAGVRNLEHGAALAVAVGVEPGQAQPGDYRPSRYRRSFYLVRRTYQATDFVGITQALDGSKHTVFRLPSTVTGGSLLQGIKGLDAAQATTVAGTDGGEANGWEKAGRFAMIGGVVAVVAGLAFMRLGQRGLL